MKMLNKLKENIKEVNEGHSQDGEYVGFVLIGMMLLKVNMDSDLVIEGKDISLVDWNEVMDMYNDNGGDEEIGDIKNWGSLIDVVMELGMDIKDEITV